MRQRLVLFDIDGTLIRDDGAAREAYATALSEVHGYQGGSLRKYDFSGRTDTQITYEVLCDSGFDLPSIDAKMDRLWEVYIRELKKLVNATRIRVLPGVLPILQTLSKTPGVILGLLTGNIEPGARIKLGPHDMNRFFAFGAFGSDAQEREHLPPIAVERAQQLHGHKFDPRDVVVIGDSIYDVRCGIPHQATTIAVATGHTSADKLRDENPDHFFDSLEPEGAVLSAILGQT